MAGISGMMTFMTEKRTECLALLMLRFDNFIGSPSSGSLDSSEDLGDASEELEDFRDSAASMNYDLLVVELGSSARAGFVSLSWLRFISRMGEVGGRGAAGN
jgi:hypothetical protein